MALRDIVDCWNCRYKFDLIKAEWCNCGSFVFSTKICPNCQKCLCSNPDFKPDSLQPAPDELKKVGFNSIWKPYLHNIDMGSHVFEIGILVNGGFLMKTEIEGHGRMTFNFTNKKELWDAIDDVIHDKDPLKGKMERIKRRFKGGRE